LLKETDLRTGWTKTVTTHTGKGKREETRCPERSEKKRGRRGSLPPEEREEFLIVSLRILRGGKGL